MKIIDLQPQHAKDAARLHILGQPGTFLTNLGPDVLTLFYSIYPHSTGSLGFAMIEAPKSTPAQRAVAAGDPTCLGFVVATTNTGRLFFDLGTRHLVQFLPQLLRRYVQQPKLVVQSLQTLYYPFMAHTPATAHTPTSNDLTETDKAKAQLTTAELLAIMVEPEQRNHGIGQQLLDQLIAAGRQRGIEAFDVTVDAQNSGARRFYERNGFMEMHTFRLYGRTMCYYRSVIAMNHAL